MQPEITQPELGPKHPTDPCPVCRRTCATYQPIELPEPRWYCKGCGAHGPLLKPDPTPAAPT